MTTHAEDPKSYAYTCKPTIDPNDGKRKRFSVTKFKGLRKNLFNSRRVNLKSMLSCVRDPITKIDCKNLQFKLNRMGQVKTRDQSKLFQMVYTKRWIAEDGVRTFPFGYSSL